MKHYMQFVDGFWQMIAGGLRSVGYRAAASRLMAWNNRNMNQ